MHVYTRHKNNFCLEFRPTKTFHTFIGRNNLFWETLKKTMQDFQRITSIIKSFKLS